MHTSRSPLPLFLCALTREAPWNETGVLTPTRSVVSMRFDARGSLELAGYEAKGAGTPLFLCALTREAPWNGTLVVPLNLTGYVSMRFDARGSLERNIFSSMFGGILFLCALTREAPWNSCVGRWKGAFRAVSMRFDARGSLEPTPRNMAFHKR